MAVCWINLTREDVMRAGVELTPRVASVLGGRPRLEDGHCLDVANVVWCTGFGHDFSWIRLPVLDADGMPRHERGVVVSEPGLYFVGLPFMTRFASALVGGVGQGHSRCRDEHENRDNRALDENNPRPSVSDREPVVGSSSNGNYSWSRLGPARRERVVAPCDSVQLMGQA